MQENDEVVFTSGFKKLLITLLATACIVATIVGLWLDHTSGHFFFEALPGFYGLYGVVAAVVLILVAKYCLRPLVMRTEDYYDN